MLRVILCVLMLQAAPAFAGDPFRSGSEEAISRGHGCFSGWLPPVAIAACTPPFFPPVSSGPRPWPGCPMVESQGCYVR
jgi:hypothetical protein